MQHDDNYSGCGNLHRHQCRQPSTASKLDNRTSWILTGRILAGYWIAAIAILLASWALGLSANVMPIHYVGYLGLVPIMLGVKTLIGQFRGREDAPVGLVPEKFSVLAITTTLFANSTDTMLVFSPLLADSESGTDYMIIVGYIVMATIWFVLALFFSRHAARLQPVSVAAPHGWRP